MGANIGEHPPTGLGAVPPDHQIPLQQSEPTGFLGVEVLQVADRPPLFSPGGVHDDQRQKRHDRESTQELPDPSAILAMVSVRSRSGLREFIATSIVFVGCVGFNQIETNISNNTKQG